MARPCKGPWRRKSDNCWHTAVNGKQVKLAVAHQTYKVAMNRYHQVHASKQRPEIPLGLLTVSQLLNNFLVWSKYNRDERTYEWYKRFLVPFDKYISVTFPASHLRLRTSSSTTSTDESNPIIAT